MTTVTVCPLFMMPVTVIQAWVLTACEKCLLASERSRFLTDFHLEGWAVLHSMQFEAEVHCSFITTTVLEQHPRSYRKGATFLLECYIQPWLYNMKSGVS